MTPPREPSRTVSAGPPPPGPTIGWVVWPARLLLGFVILVLLGWILLQHPAVATRLANAILARLAAPRSTLRVALAGGDWLSRLELRGLRMMRGDTLIAAVDTVRIRYRLAALLSGRIELTHVALLGPVIVPPPADAADSTGPARSSGPLAAADMVRGRFYGGPPLRIDRLTARDGRIAWSQGSGLRLARVALRASDLRLGPGFSFRLDSLGMHVARPGEPGSGADLSLVAALEDGRVDLRRLQWRSRGTELDADGLLALDVPDSIAEARVALRAPRLALDELAWILPGWDVDGVVATEVNLRGTRPDRLSGTVTAYTEAMRAGGLAFGPTRLEATLVDGQATTVMATVIEGARSRIDGWIRPLDPSPTYDLEVISDRLPARIPGAAWWPAIADRFPAASRLRVRGAGFADARLDVTGRLEGDAGAVALDGHLDLARGPAWTVRRLALEDIDLAHLTGHGPSSAVRGTLTGEGRSSPDGPRAAVRLDLEPSRIGDHRIARAHAEATLSGTSLVARLEVVSDAGNVRVDTIAVRWDGAGPFRVAGAHLRDLDLARLTGRADLAGRFGARLSATGRGLTRLDVPGGPLAALRAGRLTGEADLTLEPSSVQRTEIARGSARAVLRDGQVRIEGGLVSSAGALDLEADASPFAAPPTLEGRARFRDVDLAAWTGAGLRTRLNGSLAGGGHPATGTGRAEDWTATLRLEPSRVGSLAVEGGNAQGSYAAGRVRARAEIRAAGDTLSARGEAVLRDSPRRGQVQLTLPLGVLAALAGWDSLGARGAVVARATVAGDSLASATADGTITGSGAIGGVRLDSLFASLRLRDGTVVLDTLAARSNVARASGGGHAVLTGSATSGDLRIALIVEDATPLRPLLGLDTLVVVDGTAALRLGGGPAGRTFDVRCTARSLAWNDLRVLGADASGRGTLDRQGRLVGAEAQARLRRLHARGVTARDVSAGATHGNGETAFRLATSGEQRHGLELAGRARQDSLGAEVFLSRLDIRTDSTTWRLVRPGRLGIGADRLEVQDFELRSPGGHAVAAGRLDRHGDQDFRLDVAGVGLGPMASWLGRDRLDGTLRGSVAVSGPARSPRGSADLDLDLASDRRPAGTLRTRLTLETERLDLEGRLATPGGDSLTWSGRLPVAVSFEASAPADGPVRVLDGDVDVRIRAQSFPLSALSPLLDPRAVGELQGRLTMDTRLRGTGRALEGSGPIEVDGAVLPLPALGVAYRDITVRGSLQGSRLGLREARATSGKGTLQVSGETRFASVTRIEPNLKVTSQRFDFVRTADLHVTASVDVTLTGTLGAPVIRGRGTVEDSDVHVVQSDAATGQDVRLTAADLQMMEETFGFVEGPAVNLPMQIYDASDLDLTVTLARNNWVRQRNLPKMAVALAGEVRIHKAPHAGPRLFGRVDLVPGRGYVDQFGRSFDIAGGGVLLNGDMKDHAVDVQAEYRPPASPVTIRLDIKGTPERLGLTLSSEPAMSEVEIVSYIATGRSSSVRATGDGSATFARDLGLAAIAGVAETAAQQASGLDVVQVRFDALQGATLVAGRYLDPRLYVGFVQPLQYKESGSPTAGTSHQTSVEIEYAIQRWLVLNLKGETSRIRSFIRVHRAF